MNLKSKLDELSEVREKLHEKIVERGSLLSFSSPDPNRTKNKIDDLSNDIEKLQDEEFKVLDEISAIKHSEEFIADLEAKKLALSQQVEKLNNEMTKTQQTLLNKAGESPNKIISGVDPMKTAAEVAGLLDKVEVIRLALEQCRIASAILSKLGEDIPYKPATSPMVDKKWRPEVPKFQEPHIRYQ